MEDSYKGFVELKRTGNSERMFRTYVEINWYLKRKGKCVLEEESRVHREEDVKNVTAAYVTCHGAVFHLGGTSVRLNAETKQINRDMPDSNKSSLNMKIFSEDEGHATKVLEQIIGGVPLLKFYE